MSNGDGAPARIPRDRLVRWVPRKLGALAAEVSTPSDLCIVSDVLEELRRQTASTPERRIAGLLVGRRGRHVGSARPFALVESCVACEGVRDPGADPSPFHEEILALREAVEGDEVPGEVLGWYHSHSLLGVFLSEQDTHFHEEHFPESWQCALILVSDRERPAGGIFQQTEGLGLRRSIYVPFYEVVGDGAALPDGRRRCSLDWENYVTDASVVRGDAGDGTEGPGAGAATAGAAAGSGEIGAADGSAPPGDRVPPRRPVATARAGGPPRRVGELSADIPVVMPTDETEGFLGRHRRRAVTVGLVVALALGGWWVWGEVADGGSDAAPAPPTDRVARDVDAVDDVGAGPEAVADAGIDAASAPPETAASPAGATDVPATSGAASAEADAPAARPEPARPEPGGDTGAGAGAAGAEAPATGGGAVAAFQQAYGDFDASVGTYGQRRQAFAAGTLECATLADAYRRADEAFITLSARYARPGVAAAVGGRYEDAAARMENVERHFDASGCPRPQ